MPLLPQKQACIGDLPFRLTDVFSSGFSNPNSRIPEFPKSEFPKPDSPQKPGTTGIRGGMRRFSFGDFSLHYRAWRSLSQGLPGPSNLHAPYRGSFLKYAGIISSALRLSSPVWVWLWAQYTIPPLSCQPFPANSKNFAVFHKSRSFILYKSH